MQRLPRFIFVSTLAISACSTTPNALDSLEPAAKAEPLPDYELKDAIHTFADTNQDDDSETVQAEEANDAPVDFSPEETLPDNRELSQLGAEIPMELNSQVKKWIHRFTKEDPERFARFVHRGKKYRKMIETILAQHGVPKELYYLAFIESGFATQATSHASAVGIWQFIRGTGVRYGLTVNGVLDERRDPVLATHAAAQYLGDLYRVYQSWYLAMASYNAGEARIMGAIMRANTRDFWQLVHKRALPVETMNYIPKFIAAAVIGENPGKYGFSADDSMDWTETAEVKVPASLRLVDIARSSGISHSDLIDLNPALRKKFTVSNGRATNLRIWKKDLEKFEENRASLASLPRSIQAEAMEQQAEAKAPSPATNRSMFYRVKRGDNLEKIAQAHGLSIAELKKMNQLRSSKVLRGQRLLISQAPVKNYRVRRGDNLAKIADRFGMSVQQLKNINRMVRNRVYPGQLLTVNDKAAKANNAY